MWELRYGGENQGASNDVQSMSSNEACGRLQSCETKAQRFEDTSLQGLRFSSVLLVRHLSDAAEADTIHVSCVSLPTLCVRSGETAVDAKSRHGEADVAMRCLPRREGAASSVEVKLQITIHLFAVSVRMLTYCM